jgi:predicted MFS family arabinose efflux permease
LSLVSPEQRGRALAIVIGGQTIALATGVPLGSWIAHSFSWQASFWLVSGITLIASLLIRLLFPKVAPQFVPSLKQRLSFAAQPVVGLGLLVTLLWSVGAITFYTYVSDVFLHLGATELMLSLVLLVWGIASFFRSSIGGYFTDQLSPDCTIKFVISGSILMLTGIAVLSNAPHFTGVVILAAVFMALYGMFTWAFMPAQQSRLVRLGGNSAGIVISLNASAIYLGSASGAFFGRLLVEHSFVSMLCFADTLYWTG